MLISCSIHATEIGATQMAMELAHRLATNDTLQRALRDVVVLLVPSMNPDGHQMVTEWYRQGLGTRWEGGPIPWLYHHYVGHDNNRDWYMVTQKETKLVTDLEYRDWFPLVFYDVHQQGSAGMRLSMPPLVDPVNPNLDPVIVRGISHIGAEMALALESRGKSGVGDGVTYDLWWHGGARSTPTRHNVVGLLTEAASVRIATPITQKPEDLRGHPRGLPRYERRVNFPNPWPGGTWRLRDIMDYELIANEALVKMLAQQREEYVRNYVQLGRRQVRLGETQAPYAFVIPAEQRDPMAARRLVEVLRVGAVEVDKATAPFSAGGRQYAAGSYVVRMAQPYRAHAKDLLEPQSFPKMEQYPGGPPERPYDVAGWTLPHQMGVRVDQIDTPLQATTQPIRGLRDEERACARGRGLAVLDARNTASYAQVWRALARRVPVRVTDRPLTTGGVTYPAGSFVVTRADTSVDCASAYVSAVPSGRTLASAPRVALYKSWTASMDEGWTRWLFDQTGVAYTSVTDSMIRAGRLRDRFDVVLVPDLSLRDAREGMSAAQVPAAYAGGLGAPGIDALKRFAEEGGTVVLLDHAIEIASGAFGMPVQRVTPSGRMAEGGGGADADTAPARTTAARAPLYAPGSILRVLVDSKHPVAAGMPDTAGVYFTNSTTLDVSRVAGARVIARYPASADDILMSGYLQGGEAIAGLAAAADAPLGRGRVVMFGFRPQYRGQSYGTFKALFNALLGAASVP